MSIRALAGLAAALLALAGCGGGGGEVSVPSASPTVARAPAPRTLPQGGAEGTPAPAPRTATRPSIVQWRIPFGPRRRVEMARYSLRHYGQREWRLRDPQVIVEHWTQTSTVSATRDTFLPDRPDPELHELPGTCSHFVVSRTGAIYQLVDLGIRCRHAFAVNWTAIGIEHVGFSDGDVLGNRRELAASLALTSWLRCRYGIQVRNVIGHAETVRSPYWRELHPRGPRSTHGDMGPRAMRAYRASLARWPCPGASSG